MSKISLDNMEKSSFVKESIRILHEAYISKKLVLFIGAGVDVPSEVPLWTSAVAEFAKHMNINSDGVDNLRIPQYYYNSRGKKEYVELCRDIFGYNKELHINKIHEKIVDFNVNTIITTNYTNFIEREMNNRGYIYKVICQDKDLPYTKNENLIIKMHGDFEHDNFVLKEDDYLKYSDNFRLIETYIKSIIAKNVILFVGYSFNDPDVKQLFTWVNEVLKSDFQHAYMLEGYKDYDENVFEYYKNLGVNVIYTNSLSENKEEALLEVLDMVMKGNSANISNVDVAKKQFMSCLNMNYILGRYLRKGLSLCNLRLELNRVSSAVERVAGKSEEANALLVKLSERLSAKTILPADDPYAEIVNALRKSSIGEIAISNFEENEINNEIVPVICFEDEQWFYSILDFNYKKLRKFVEDNEIIDNGDDEQFYLRQAYIYYILGEFAKSYKCLCDAAKKAFYNHKYYMYYIAQFNKYRIKDYIKRDKKVSEEVHKKIKDDLEKIDLDNILISIPDLSSTNNEILKEIGTFQLHYSLFQDAYRLSEKVKEQQNTIYDFYSGVPTYATMQWMIEDYYRYLVYNYLMIDQYSESKEVLVLYVKSILESACTPDKEIAEKDNLFGQTGNIHASAIGKFELFLMIKYMSEEDILNMFMQYQIDIVPAEDDCNGYISGVLDNLRIEDNLKCAAQCWNCITIIPYINPNIDLVEKALDWISEKFSHYIYRAHQGVIYRFLYNCYRNKYFKKKQDGTFNVGNYALGRFFENLLKKASHTGGTENHSYGEILEEVSNIFYGTYQEFYNGNIEGLICDNNNLIMAKIYPNCDKKNKEIIKNHFENWIGRTSWQSFEMYYYIVVNGIIEPDVKYEQLIFEQMADIEKKSRNCYPNDYNNILVTMCNLDMNNKLVQIDRFKEMIKESEESELVFLSDKDNFDYKKFNLEWLTMYAGGLLKEIAQNKKARYNISRIYAEKIERGEVSNKLLRIYFKYFVNVTEEV
ncbi:MAG: SIR2 family protein [Roseburia sp.]|nr:SIR2 family protein [Roseburia sp.]